MLRFGPWTGCHFWPKASGGPQPEYREAFYHKVQALIDARQ